MDVSIQVPAIDEPPGQFRSVLRSIRSAQNRFFEPTYEAWVTPTNGVTMDVAAEEGFDVHKADTGKLSARNQAHDHAVGSGQDAIITMDADSHVLSNEALDSLIEPLKSGNAVACNSVQVASRTPEGGVSALGMVVDLGGTVEDVIRPHMHGQASSFTVDAWEYAGPFDETMDQTDSVSVRTEEEFGFYSRLREYGDVIFPESALVYNNPRRHVCRLPGMGDTEYCSRLGEVTFSPD